MNIVAIGGGELSQEETLPIDRFICELTGKNQPNALFIPTASSDAPGYCDTFDRIYGQRLGCQTQHLTVANETPALSEIQQKIDWADLIYVGGGNTQAMMDRWRSLGLDAMLKEAGNRGCVLSGLSAGAICWFESGLSDSESFANEASWQYTNVSGLGLDGAIFCPHVDAESRHEPFKTLLQKRNRIGMGADNGAALWIQDGRYQAVTCLPNAKVGLYVPSNDGIEYAAFSDDETLPVGEFL